MWPTIIFCVIIVIGVHFLEAWVETMPVKVNPSKVQYNAKMLLTKYEWKNYMGMREYATAQGLIICPKIRLADLIEPRTYKDRKDWQKQFNRIKAKHVDFVFCDPDMRVKLIVELDDYTHERADRKERDAFVDAALTSAGYQIVHIHRFDDAAVAAMDAILRPAPEHLNEEAAIG